MIILGSFLIFSCGGGGGNGDGDGNEITYTVKGLTPDTTYYWTVVADDGKDITGSETRSFTTM